jgi:hypothetical protein
MKSVVNKVEAFLLFPVFIYAFTIGVCALIEDSLKAVAEFMSDEQ